LKPNKQQHTKQKKAASSLQRGPATCRTCEGRGVCACGACRGEGVLASGGRPQLNQVRHAAQRVQGLLGVERAAQNTEWLVSNRCKRCHGQGVCVCPTCGGIGVRAPSVKPPPLPK
jgi:DnaJ-class molecular chaperone